MEVPTSKFNLIFTNLGLVQIAKTIYRHLDLKTLANCRLVSKSWKTSIDNSRVIDQLLRQELGQIRDRHQDQWNQEILRNPFSSHIYDQLIENASIRDLKIIISFIKKRETQNLEIFVGNTPFHVACKEGQFDVVELMVNNQSKTFSINLNAQNVNGMTPFDLAFNSGRMKIVQLLWDECTRKRKDFNVLDEMILVSKKRRFCY